MRRSGTALARRSGTDASRGVAPDTIAARAQSERELPIWLEEDEYIFVSLSPIQ